MAGSSPEIVRKPRADAVRNRERVLEAAKAVFSAGGSEASLEAVARQAGVGIGTLFDTAEPGYTILLRVRNISGNDVIVRPTLFGIAAP